MRTTPCAANSGLWPNGITGVCKSNSCPSMWSQVACECLWRYGVADSCDIGQVLAGMLVSSNGQNHGHWLDNPFPGWGT